MYFYFEHTSIIPFIKKHAKILCKVFSCGKRRFLIMPKVTNNSIDPNNEILILF